MSRIQEKVQEVHSKLKYGDTKLIAEIANVHLDTVSKTLRGEYKPNTPSGRLIIEVAERLIQSREDTKMAIIQDVHPGNFSPRKIKSKNVQS